MTRQAAVQAARGWLRTPFHHHGRVKGVGVDCAQLLIAVFSEIGKTSPDLNVGDYAWDWHLHRDEEKYLSHINANAHRVETPLPGDIALFKFGRCVSHAAIVVEWPKCIHAYHKQGVTWVNAEQDAELAGRLHSFWSVFGSDE